jgi:hypothetical protein
MESGEKMKELETEIGNRNGTDNIWKGQKARKRKI